MKTRKRIIRGWPARSNATHNPFQALLSDATESHGWQVKEYRPFQSCFLPAAIWHWHWPEGQFAHRSRNSAWIRLIVLFFLVQVARLRRIKVIWTAHNVGGHILDNRPVEDVFWRFFHKHVQGVHYLSNSSRDAAFQRFPTLQHKPHVVTRHGHYRDVYGPPLTRQRARQLCGLDEERRTVVFCGKVSAYKGVVDLVSSFRQITGDRVQLLVAGDASDEEARLVRSSAGEDQRVHLMLKHLNDTEIKAVISSADLVVLPYREVTNSGSVLLALSLDRPVLSANKGSVPEVMSQVESPWLSTYAARLTAEDLTATLDLTASLAEASPDLCEFSWSAVSAQLSTFYERICSNSPTRNK